MHSTIFKDRVATWQLKNTNLRLSPLAAEVLVERRKVRWNELRLLHHCEWNFGRPSEPLTGGGSAIIGTATGPLRGGVDASEDSEKRKDERGALGEKEKV